MPRRTRARGALGTAAQGRRRPEAAPGQHAAGSGGDGYGHLVAWRPTVPGESGLVHSTHFRPRLAPLDWQPIGHPDKQGDRTGTPAVAVDALGRAHVFVRNAGGGLSMRAQKEKGGWEGWRDLKGEGVGETPVTAVRESGAIEVFATGRDGILHWRAEKQGTPPALQEGVGARARPGSLRALATSEDRVTLFFVDDASGEVRAWRPGGDPVPLLAAAGPGPLAALRCEIDGHDCTLLAQRTAGGRVAFAAYPTELESAGAWWTESGPELPPDAEVALALDEDGRVVAASLSPSTGRLLLTRRKEEPGLALAAWGRCEPPGGPVTRPWGTGERHAYDVPRSGPLSVRRRASGEVHQAMRRRSAVPCARPPGRPERARARPGRVRGGPRRLAHGGHGRQAQPLRPTEGGLLRWTETTVGGPEWSGPHFVPAAGLNHLTVVQGADRYVHFFGRRERAAADGGRAVDIVHAIQYQTGLAFTDWRSLGGPHRDREEGRAVGPPVGAVAQDGTVHVFVRTARHGLALRREARTVPGGPGRTWAVPAWTRRPPRSPCPAAGWRSARRPAAVCSCGGSWSRAVTSPALAASHCVRHRAP